MIIVAQCLPFISADAAMSFVSKVCVECFAEIKKNQVMQMLPQSVLHVTLKSLFI